MQESTSHNREAERERRLANLADRAKRCVACLDWKGTLAHLQQIAMNQPGYRDTTNLAALAWREFRPFAAAPGDRVPGQWRHRGKRSNAWNRFVCWRKKSYRDVPAMLERAHLQTEQGNPYGRGQRAWETGQQAEALAASEQIMNLDPGHRDAAKQLQRARATAG